MGADVFTPGWSILSNIGSITALESQYLRIGDVVTVSGAAIFDITDANAVVDAVMTLPAPSNFQAAPNMSWASGNLGGVIVGTDQNVGTGVMGHILGDLTRDQARVTIIKPGCTGPCLLAFHYTYRVLPP